MDTPSVPTTFIYALIDPRTGRPRYVGKSNAPAQRRRAHIRNAREGERGHRAAWLRELLRRGLRPGLLVLERCAGDTWADRERHWIATLSVELTNHTAGGETCDWTPAMRANASERMRGWVPSESTRQRLAEAQRQRDPSTRAVAHLRPYAGRPPSEAARAKMRAAKLGRPSWNKGRQWPEHVRANMRAAALRRGARERSGPQTADGV